MDQPVTTSVIIPTYNGAHKIIQVLDSLQLQVCAPDEVIVVIDGSTDHTLQLIKERNYQLPGFKIIEQENGGRAKVRNTGAAAAQGDLLLFLDDDMIVPGVWLASHVAHHTAYKDTILTGRLEDPNENKGNDFLQFKSWLNRKWNKGLDTGDADTALLAFPYLTANNFSIPRALFLRSGGFDERLTDAEDYDLAVRAQLNGTGIYFSKKAFAWHNDITNCSKYIKRLRQYDKAQQVLLQLKPEVYKGRHRYAAEAPAGLKGRVFRMFCSRTLIRAIDKSFFRWMPESIRFRLYDYVVTANGSFFPEIVALD